MTAKNAPWSREASKMLIDFYEQTPCLYVVASPDYYNRNKRNVALSNIAEALQDIRPGTTTDEIKSKCNGLRTQFLKAESTRVQSKNNSGSGRDADVEPTLWCYELLSFLKPHTIHCKDRTNSESNAGDEPNQFDIKFEHVVDTSRGYEEEEEEKDVGEIEFNHERSTSSTSTTPAKATRLVKTRKRIRSKEDAPVKVVIVKEGRSAIQSFGYHSSPVAENRAPENNSAENNLDIFGQLVASELRSLKSASTVRRLKYKILCDIYDAQKKDEEKESNVIS